MRREKKKEEKSRSRRLVSLPPEALLSAGALCTVRLSSSGLVSSFCLEGARAAGSSDVRGSVRGKPPRLEDGTAACVCFFRQSSLLTGQGEGKKAWVEGSKRSQADSSSHSSGQFRSSHSANCSQARRRLTIRFKAARDPGRCRCRCYGCDCYFHCPLRLQHSAGFSSHPSLSLHSTGLRLLRVRLLSGRRRLLLQVPLLCARPFLLRRREKQRLRERAKMTTTRVAKMLW